MKRREQQPAHPARATRIAAALDSAEAGLVRLPRRLRVPDAALLALFLAAGAAASVALGVDRNWDLLNYHLYNPLALLTDRSGDIAPPGAQRFFNPAADLPFFWLLRSLNEHPLLVAALMGLPAGAAAFLVLLLSRLVLREAGAGSPALFALLSTLGAATGAGFRSQIGTTHNDLLTAVPLLAALLLALRAAVLSPPRPPPAATLVLAGSLAGAAVGLKLTNAPFAAGLGGALAAALWAGGQPLARPLGLLLGGGALGFALAAGPWMLHLWQEWGNPFFPFFDTLFAAGRPPAPVGRDPRFLPQGALEWLFFPFTWALSDAPRSSEMEMRDPRVALAFLALVALALGARRCLARPAVAFLAAFLAAVLPALAPRLLDLSLRRADRDAVLPARAPRGCRILAPAADGAAGRAPGGGQRGCDRPSRLGPRSARAALPGRGLARTGRGRAPAAGTRRAAGLPRRRGPGGNALGRPFRAGAVRSPKPLRGRSARGAGRGAAHLPPRSGTRRRRGRGSGVGIAHRNRHLPARMHQLDQRRPRPAGLPGGERRVRRLPACAHPPWPAREHALRHGRGGPHARRPTRAAPAHRSRAALAARGVPPASPPHRGRCRRLRASTRTPRSSASKRAKWCSGCRRAATGR